MIYTEYSRPAPPSEIVKRLKQVDDRLDLMYLSFPHRDGINMNLTQYWAIIQRWRENDKRRQMIQRGLMREDADFDVLAKLPLDCSPEDAFNYFEKGLKGQFKGNPDVRYFLDNLHKFNKKQQEENLKPVTEHAEEMIEANVTTLFKEQGKTIPKVFVSDGGNKKK